MTERILYVGPLSLFSRKVEIALREKGLLYARELVPFTQAKGYSPKHPGVVAGNPLQKVPVLVEGDFTLYDSTVILEYLEDAYPEPPLYPRGAKARAKCRLVEQEADEILFLPVRSLLYRTEPPLTDAAKQAAREAEGAKAEVEIDRQFGGLDARLEARDFFCGEFSAADIGMFMTVLFTQRLKGPRVSGHPRLAAWYARMLNRPSCAKAAEEIAAADRALSPSLG
ncbi:glutathione S-transferase family protein [Dongia sedimenti]|uniref:Glutathione S-transferase family protein n=1 Tax=Dongia sedimenti TaxID=3064282 RepID=A0ABU0YGB3_9PROT|nr:glutathione S-transferase family protein [Rhodospirillaceae bacterium R-7]